MQALLAQMRRKEIKLSSQPATIQRHREIAVEYAERPPGEMIGDFLARVGVGHRNWYNILHEPDCIEIIQQADELRRTVSADRVRAMTDAIAYALVEKAITGDVPAIRLAFEVAGIIRAPGSNVTTNVAVRQTLAGSMITDAESAEEIVAQYEDNRRQLIRRLESWPAVEADPRDSGPEHNGGTDPA